MLFFTEVYRSIGLDDLLVSVQVIETERSLFLKVTCPDTFKGRQQQKQIEFFLTNKIIKMQVWGMLSDHRTEDHRGHMILVGAI